MNLYDVTIPIFQKFLTGIDNAIDKAAAYAAERKFDKDILVTARLAPDAYSFARQVQSACDMSKWGASKVTGKDAPSIPDDEKTLDELKARIKTAKNYLETFTREDFANCEDRPCTHTWMGGKSIKASDYLAHFLMPNFFFHVTTAYQILRHNGVPLGKFDYIVTLPFNPA